MIKSMTGFGQAQFQADGYEVTLEVKSVNHRFLDINIRLPRKYMLLEERIKEIIKKYAIRGRFDLNLSIHAETSSNSLKVDKKLAMDYYDSLKDLAENLNIPTDFKVFDFTRLPDIFKLEPQSEDLELVWSVIEITLTQALEQLVTMRRREGEHLVEDLRKRIDFILGKVVFLEMRAPEVIKLYQQKLTTRLEELLPDTNLDLGRLFQEIAFFADRSDITEEIVRLNSHLRQLHESLIQDEAIGRKSDFLLQEMFREINTIASKASDLEMSQTAVEAKAELEKIREQIQNIE